MQRCLHVVVVVLALLGGVWGNSCKFLRNKTTSLKVSGKGHSRVEGNACGMIEEFTAKHPNVGVEPISYLDVFGWNIDDEQVFLERMLHDKSSEIEILDLDTQWVATMQDDLVELDVSKDVVREKWRSHSTDSGKLLALPRNTNQLVMFYRKDLFDKHGLTWPTTWEEFDITVAQVQAAERAIRGNNDFWGFVLTTDLDSANRMMYMFVTLLSGFDGGQVVERNGTVSVDNPMAAKTLAMWKNWFGKIVPPAAFGYGWGDVNNYFKGDHCAVLLQWYSVGPDFAAHMKAQGWEIAAAPIPGINGAGCSGDWSIGVNKNTPIPAIANDYIQAYLKNYSNFWIHNEEPALTKDFEDPNVWKVFHQKNPIIASSFEIYPDFWARLVHRPSKGCKSLYGECTAIAMKHMASHFLQDVSADIAVANMGVELKRLLGQVDTSTDSYSRDEWTGSRSAMVMVCVVGALALAVIGGVIYYGAISLHASTVRIPVSVMLGLVAATSFAVVLGVVISFNDNSMRDLSEDWASKLRSQSLLAAELSIYGSIDSVVGRTGATHAILMQRTLGNIKVDLLRMRLQPRSLVVIIDRADGNLLLSSDSAVQAIGEAVVPSNPNIHPWVQGAVQNVVDWRNAFIDPEKAHLYTAGEKVYASMLVIRRLSEENDLVYDINWLVLYITPHEVIMGEAAKTLDEAVDLSVILTVLGFIILLVCATMVTRPFMYLVHDMQLVKLMKMDSITQRDSVLLEVSALLRGFHNMCNILDEYKAYMPATLFVEDDSDKLQSEVSSKISLSTESVMKGSVNTQNITNLRMQTTTKAVTLLTIEYTGGAPEYVTEVLNAVVTVSHTTRGVMLSTTGDQTIVGFNVAVLTMSHEYLACSAGLVLKDIIGSPAVMGMGLARGKATIATCGTSSLKAFVALGCPIRLSRIIANQTVHLSSVIMTDNELATIVKGRIKTEVLSLYPTHVGKAKQDSLLHIVQLNTESNALEGGEWMYHYAGEKNDTDETILQIFLKFGADGTDRQELLAELEKLWVKHTEVYYGKSLDHLKDMKE